ncbi:MAG: Gfo/Idh/MocA family oxidoreductase [Planctomycetia bacterium]|nr:Gfo/Idh/MocA family oxidoreductase [Planctomycetia bacterium]
MVRVGLVGIGFMGMIHYLAYQKVPGVKVVAICERDAKKRAGDWTDIQGNFGPRGSQMDLSGIDCYESYEEFLLKSDVDLVDLCLPTEMHVSWSLQALAAGKHVFVEKPLALTTAEADRCLSAAKQAGKLHFVGHVLPFFPEFSYALKFVQSGQGGKLQAAHLRRLICKPLWRKGPQADGPAVDLHIHDNHFACLLAGTPKAVRSKGVVDRDNVVQHVETQYLYDDVSQCITSASGALYQQGCGFSHGFTILMEKASLLFDSLGIPLTLLTHDGKSEKVSLPGSGDPVDAFSAEIAEVVASVRQGKRSAILDGKLGRDALAISLSEEDAVKSGREVNIPTA